MYEGTEAEVARRLWEVEQRSRTEYRVGAWRVVSDNGTVMAQYEVRRSGHKWKVLSHGDIVWHRRMVTLPNQSR